MNLGIEEDRLVDWLVGGLSWTSSIVHVGQYCGPWKASTAGHGLASFHLVLSGTCYLHRPGRPAIVLGPRDGVFLLRDQPHHLSPESDPAAHCRPVAMLPMSPPAGQATALACGFFQFHGAMSQLMAASFPDHVLLRAEDRAAQPVARVFDLLLAEAGQAALERSPLLERLVDLLFFYVMREVARTHRGTGLWALGREPAFARLLEAVLREPGHDWSADAMAGRVHMSRASFFRRFTQLCGQTPAQFLLALRMQVAAQRLERGESVALAAEHVGYQSYAAFSRAFKRVLGAQPGAYQRQRRQGDAAPAGTH